MLETRNSDGSPLKKVDEDLIKEFREKFAQIIPLINQTGKIEDLEQFLLKAVEKARKDGYEEGLNIRRGYNDPELLKQIEKQAVEELRENQQNK